MVAAYGTGCECMAAESSATAEDVAVDVGKAFGADDGCIVSIIVVDVHLCIAKDMAVLAAAEDRTVDGASIDSYRG